MYRVVYRATDSMQEHTFSELHFSTSSHRHYLPWPNPPVDVLDGAMVLLGSITLNIAHPGFLLRQDYVPVHSDTEKEYAQFANTPVQYD